MGRCANRTSRWHATGFAQPRQGHRGRYGCRCRLSFFFFTSGSRAGGLGRTRRMAGARRRLVARVGRENGVGEAADREEETPCDGSRDGKTVRQRRQKWRARAKMREIGCTMIRMHATSSYPVVSVLGRLGPVSLRGVRQGCVESRDPRRGAGKGRSCHDAGQVRLKTWIARRSARTRVTVQRQQGVAKR